MNTQRIRELNDAFRRTFNGGCVMLTAGFNALPEQTKRQAFERIKTFETFDRDNDPYGEHDMVFAEVDGEKYIATISYYDRDAFSRGDEFASKDAADPQKTTRVLTVMRADEY